MAPLAKTSKYLRDAGELQRTVRRNVHASSIFEGASPRAFHPDTPAETSASPRSSASAKKRDKPGQEIRVLFSLPEGSTPDKLTLKEGESRTYGFKVK